MRKYFYSVAVFFLWAKIGLEAKPIAVYLTLQGDPATTIVIQWLEKEKGPDRALFYSELGEDQVHPIEVKAQILRGGVAKFYCAELTHLTPNSEYVFWLEKEKGKALGPYRFRTLPQTLDRPVRFVVGGDAYANYKLFCKMNAAIAMQNPAFVVVGGDMAYAHGYITNWVGAHGDWKRWKTFLEVWSEQMVDEEGRMIPIVPVVGNHDVRGNFAKFSAGQTPKPLFYDLFCFGEDLRAYRVLDVGGPGGLSLFLLDTGHTHKVEEEQKKWLEQELQAHKEASYKMAVYHVPAFPGIASYDRHLPTKVRHSWVGAFEEGGVQAAFEHHCHVYKRSVPIREGREDPTGIQYFGDGSWGSRPRKAVPDLWYIAKSASVNAVFVVDVSSSSCSIRGMGNDGQFFDEAPAIFPQKK